MVGLPSCAMFVALTVLAAQPTRWEARAVILAPALADREAIDVLAGSGRLTRTLVLDFGESVRAVTGRTARVEVRAVAPTPARAVQVANDAARWVLDQPWPRSAPPQPGPTLADEAVTATVVPRPVALVVWAALACGLVAAVGIGGAVEFVKAGGWRELERIG